MIGMYVGVLSCKDAERCDVAGGGSAYTDELIIVCE